MNKNRVLSLIMVLLTIVCMSACSKNSGLKVNTMVGELDASDYNNWSDYEQKVIENTKLNADERKEIDDIITPLEDGTASDAEINTIKEEYGSIKKYKEHLEFNMKHSKVRESVEENLTITDDDREEFISKFSSTFAGMNAIVFQFDSPEIATSFVENNIEKSKDDVLKYIASACNKDSMQWNEVNELSKDSGISILHNADSDRYNYCESNTLKSIFNEMQDGQMSGVFEYGGMSTVMLRISNGVIEKDDALIDNYMLKIKREEAYKKYIIENK